MLIVSVITIHDDLQRLVNEINQASWDDANDMSDYEALALQAYLEREDTLFVACHDVDGDRTLLGIASSRLEVKPYDGSRWLYVDEVDVCADQRRKGAGKAIMRKLIEFAEAAGCEEVWLGTEVDNHAANALYRSLDPAEAEKFMGYTFEIRAQKPVL
jgi:ribosomal protein S18 acetylase RimI-like enzyme